MKSCNCTLHIFNPEACKNCVQMEFEENSYPWLPISPTAPINPQHVYPTKMVKRVTRIIEKYGPEGEYLGKEVITEDAEDVEVPDYSYPAQPFYDYPITICEQPLSGTILTSGANTFANNDIDIVSGSCTENSNCAISYTQN